MPRRMLRNGWSAVLKYDTFTFLQPFISHIFHNYGKTDLAVFRCVNFFRDNTITQSRATNQENKEIMQFLAKAKVASAWYCWKNWWRIDCFFQEQENRPWDGETEWYYPVFITLWLRFEMSNETNRTRSLWPGKKRSFFLVFRKLTYSPNMWRRFVVELSKM